MEVLQEKVLLNIKNGIDELSTEIMDYYNDLDGKAEIDLAKFNMIGKRKVAMLFYAYITYLRWFYIKNKKNNFPLFLDLSSFFDYYYNRKLYDVLNQSNDIYYYFRFLISRIELWAKKYKHHYEHRSKEIINIKILNNEYKQIWENDYLPIIEQKKIVLSLINKITSDVKSLNN